ncbi:carbohydrate kinase family protein [Opitutaceae bacterium TAV4]|nr:carbohydrate kinase family protein [Opitutaceae bacterium TAV4]
MTLPPPPPPRSGILAAGNWLVDHVKTLDAWPPQDALASILAESWGNGGSPYNILKDISKLHALQPAYPLTGIGLVGDDSDGRRILADCRAHGIDTAQLRATPDAPTSYSDVMTDSQTGRRTFFHQRGANARLVPEHFDFAASRAAAAKIFHIGYILLLDTLDQLTPSGQPRICDVLCRARAAGLLTSLDCVSENSDRFQTIVRPALPDVDILFVNDFEAGKLTGIDLHTTSTTDSIDRSAVERALRSIAALDVRRWIIFHAPSAACAAAPDGTLHWQPSLRVPSAAIRGTAGAGDAFAAGVLHGLHEDWSIADALRLGVCTAAACLASPTCSDSILPLAETLALAERHGFRPL